MLQLTQDVMHCYRSISGKLDQLEQLLINLEAKWGELATQKLGVICCLEMANVMERIEEVSKDEVNLEVCRGRCLSRMDHLVRYTRVDYDPTFSSVPCLSCSATYGLSLGPFPSLRYLFPSTCALYNHLYYHLTPFPSTRFHYVLLLGPVS